jgi:hypothetical protein
LSTDSGRVWTAPRGQGSLEAAVNVSGAVMSSASHEGSSVNSFSADGDPR